MITRSKTKDEMEAKTNTEILGNMKELKKGGYSKKDDDVTPDQEMEESDPF